MSFFYLYGKIIVVWEYIERWPGMLFLTLIDDRVKRSKLEELYIIYKRDMYVTAYVMLKDHQLSEDIVQVAIMKLNNHLDKIETIKCNKTRAYLVTIVKNLCRDYFRKPKETLSVPVEEHLKYKSAAELVEELVIRHEDTKEMLKLLTTINPNYSDIIRLRFYDELRVDEIAELLNISPNNASVRLKRALKALNKCIVERSPEDESTIS